MTPRGCLADRDDESMQSGLESRLKRKKILVVEDNDQSARLIMMVLKDMGAQEVVFAKDGAEAWDKIEAVKKSGAFNLVISDWNMPNLTGIQLLDRLRKTGSHVPFIMITGRGTVDSATRAVDSGVTVYIPKPFTPDQLSSKIANVLESASDQTT